MRVETYTCDVCRNQKKEANHWFVIIHEEAAVKIYNWPFRSELPLAQHLCGSECVNKVVGKFLSGGKWK